MSTPSYKPISPITPGPIAEPPQPVTALSFDPVSDTLWAGSGAGSVTAYYGVRGVQGASFPVGGGLPVTKILAGDNYVRATGNSSNGVGSWSKGGMNKWFFRLQTSVLTFSNVSPSSHFLVASLSNHEMVFLSSMTGSVLRRVPTNSTITHLELSSSILLSGSLDGSIRLQDPRTGLGRADGAEGLVKAHSGIIQGLQMSGNFIFSIGMGERQSRPFPDPLVKLYDLRTLRPLPPIPFSAGPAFITVLPNRTSSLAVISHQGLINILDVSNPTASNEFYQLDVDSYLTSTAVSPSAAYMAFGDAEGTIHLMSQVEEGVPFNGFEGQPVPWAHMPAPISNVHWDDSTPLNAIGLPQFDAELLSAWPSHGSTRPSHYLPTPKIPPQVFVSMRMNDNIAYASLPKELRGRRNVTNTPALKGNSRFRSGKAPLEAADAFDRSDNEIPPSYRHIEIEYSKFGVEDFDFAFYNQTNFSGLETHILNSYTNSVVQIMHYTSPVRKLAKSHLTVDCPREHCLLCELGFISRILEDAKGKNCQASNFCKTIGVLASTNAIELVDYGGEASDIDYARKIQAFHRFLFENLNSEVNSSAFNPLLLPFSRPGFPPPSPVAQLFGVTGRTITICLNCNAAREKETTTLVVDLFYPRQLVPSDHFSDAFTAIVRDSLVRRLSHKAICPACKQFATLTSHRATTPGNLPPILAINASVYTDEALSFWQTTHKRPILEPNVNLDLQNSNTVAGTGRVVYEIRAIIVKISGKKGKSHLVAIIRVPEAEDSNYPSPWFLFNDFVVTNITQEEALGFKEKWKVPAIIYLERLDLKSSLDFSQLMYKLDPAILSRDTSISLNRNPDFIRHQVLREEELPKPGMFVAIDAEFVSMQQEETEFRSDGTKRVLRPARLSLARVSVLRGSGPLAGVPFIDDHIHTSETIVDYLTEFSGIKYGDLDPGLSCYTLTPLKLVYKKLRLLVNSGCVFIGHGLSKDFRIINIHVPPEQVIDTVDVYFLEGRQRRLSLRFLSWYILGEHIQKETHDSIEDARSALRLYQASEGLKAQGVFEQKLEEVYRIGRQFNFKPPSTVIENLADEIATNS